MLETYRGREKLMRLLQYASYLASGGLQKLSYESSAGKFRIWAEAISECRTFLRLFDDAAMLSYARDYGTGKEERDKVVRWTNLVDIFCGLTFYPLEHVAWARDKKLLAGKSEKLWDLSLYTWIGSLIACIIRDLWLLRKLQHLQKSRTQLVSDSSGDTQTSSSSRQNQIKYLQRRLIISVIGFTSDLGMAIHWAPAGFLWAGKLSIGTVGLLGTVSSFAELYKYFKPAAALPDEALGSI